MLSPDQPTVVVVGEHARVPEDTARVEAMMGACSAGIDRLMVAQSRSVWLRPEEIDEIGWAGRLEPAPAVIVLIGVGTDRAMRAQAHGARQGLPVLTDHDASAIVMTAATLVSLSRVGRRMGQARVVVAGANRSPVLSGLLTEAGVGELTLWKAQDAGRYPLSEVVGSVDVVLDL
ncbi:MAG TPA: hypothetical protein VGH89_30120, partial [Pseudonocardia sp.]